MDLIKSVVAIVMEIGEVVTCHYNESFVEVFVVRGRTRVLGEQLLGVRTINQCLFASGPHGLL